MADENEKPWYKSPLHLGVIVASLTLLVLIIAYVLPYPPPPSDFSISIKPMQGAVQQGGVITTAITIKGVHGYEEPVSLSATGQPSGVVLAFVPPFGDAKPSYTSSVTINVNSNVPAGDYTIIIKGIGADGKEHSCSYTLTVKPSVEPTHTITSTTPETRPPTTKTIKINKPLYWRTYKDDVGSSINIKSVPGRTGSAIEISYDLKEEGWVSLYEEIDTEILSETEGIQFFYKGSGEPNTIQLGLKYGDGTIFGCSLDRKTVAEDWVSAEVPYTFLDCWYPDENCRHYGKEIDLKNVKKVGFGIQNYPGEGDINGSGKLVIDDVQAITS